jgi:quinol monooxygenase YgiN
MLIVTGRIATDPTLATELLADLRAGIARSMQEDGCEFYSFALEDAAAGTLLTLQIWRDEAALAAHLSTPDIAALVGKWGHRFNVQTRLYDATNERPVGVWSDPDLERQISQSRART